jgi:death on curing protein
MITQFLTLVDVKDICFEYAKTHLSYDEPIPSFETRYPGKLEAALGSVQQTFEKKLVYNTLSHQAAILFYEMVKQHPFLNGNKRIACVSLMAFLSLNERWLNVSWRELYDIAITVASSRTENREGIIRLLIDFIQGNISQE